MRRADLVCALAIASMLAGGTGCNSSIGSELLDWDEALGYAGGGVVLGRSFVNAGSQGPSDGSGVTFTLPALGVAALIMLATSSSLTSEEFMSIPAGMSSEGKHVLKEFGFDVTWNYTLHDDPAYSDALEVSSIVLGLRLAGPEEYVPSYFVYAGWGLHNFWSDSRPAASAQGPHLAAGFRLYLNYSARIEIGYEQDWFNYDRSGPVPGDGAGAFFTSLMGAWHF